MHILSKFTLLGAALALGACQQAKAPAPEANLMIMLTKADDGSSDASFIEVSGDDNCAGRVKTARGVFPAANIEYVAHYCVYSDIKFKPFAHGSAPAGPPKAFQLTLSKNGKILKSVKVLKTLKDCHKSKTNVCVSSAQGLQRD